MTVTLKGPLARFVCVVAFVAVSVAVPELAWADGAASAGNGPTAGDAVAAELFAAGKSLADAGDFAGACPKFAESVKRDARVGTLARLAECEEKLGRLVAARLHWGQARDLAGRMRDRRVDHAQQEYARIDAVVPKLLFALAGPLPPDLAIAVDSETVDATVLGVAIPVEIGTHAIRVTARGKRPFTSTVVTAAGGAVTTVPLSLEDAPAEPAVVPVPVAPAVRPPPEPPPVAPLPPVSTWSGRKTAAVIVASVGIISIGVGSVSGALSFGSWRDAKNECGAGCSLDVNAGGYNAAVTSKNTSVTEASLSTATLIAGGAALVGAAVLWFTAPKAEAPGAVGALHVLPALGPGMAGLAVTGQLGR
jgi:hypothetical protein